MQKKSTCSANDVYFAHICSIIIVDRDSLEVLKKKRLREEKEKKIKNSRLEVIQGLFKRWPKKLRVLEKIRC